MKYFWQRQEIFVLDDLLADKIIHFPTLGRFTLNLMEVRGQVRSRVSENGEIQYIATTCCKEEWKEIWKFSSFIDKYFGMGDPSFNMYGINYYEHKEIVAELKRILDDFSSRLGEEEKDKPSEVRK